MSFGRTVARKAVALAALGGLATAAMLASPAVADEEQSASGTVAPARTFAPWPRVPHGDEVKCPEPQNERDVVILFHRAHPGAGEAGKDVRCLELAPGPHPGPGTGCRFFILPGSPHDGPPEIGLAGPEARAAVRVPAPDGPRVQTRGCVPPDEVRTQAA